MASWAEVESTAPEFAARVRSRFDAGTNKTLATLRRSGSPRISASEADFADGEISLGMMPGAVKLQDVRRDPRVAMHSPTLEPPPDEEVQNWGGDAKVAGRLVRIASPSEGPFADSSFFHLDVGEVVLTYVGTPADHLVIESWHPGPGWRRRTRS